MRRGRFLMNLQFFAAPDKGGGLGGASASGATQGTEGQNENQNAAVQGGNQNTTVSQTAGQGTQPIDYAKIQQMLDGTLAAKEDIALKAYFKQQGLSQQEAEQAMSAFKAEKAKKQPDVNAIQTQLAQAQAQIRQAQIENAAVLEAVGMGIDVKTIPYVLKMADFSQAAGQDGKISNEAVKNALNKVIEDVPQLKVQPQEGAGFRQVGSASGGGTQNQPDDNVLRRAFGLS